MTIAAAVFVHNITLPTALAPQYAQGSSSVGVITHAVFCNTTGSSIAITATVNGVKLLDAFALSQHGSYVSPDLAGVVLKAGDTLECYSASVGVNLNVSGITQS